MPEGANADPAARWFLRLLSGRVEAGEKLQTDFDAN